MVQCFLGGEDCEEFPRKGVPDKRSRSDKILFQSASSIDVAHLKFHERSLSGWPVGRKSPAQKGHNMFINLIWAPLWSGDTMWLNTLRSPEWEINAPMNRWRLPFSPGTRKSGVLWPLLSAPSIWINALSHIMTSINSILVVPKFYPSAGCYFI